MCAVVRTLSLDLETFSSVDLLSCGVHKYVSSPDFEILLFGYAFDDDPVQVIDLAQGEELPEELSDALWDPEVEKTGWNLAFERNCIRAAFGREIPPEQCFDSMVLASCCGLPLSLDAAGSALGLPEDQAKMRVGKQLIREFSIPCKPTKKNGMRTRNLPEHDPENWELYKAYNQRDVETERTIRQMLIRWRPMRSEHKLWCLDQRINDKGIRVDVELAENAIRIGDAYKARLVEEAQQISGLVNPASTAQVKAWLEETEGLSVPSLNKKVIADVVAQLSDDNSKRFMDLRKEFSKSSTKKYDAIVRSVCDDGHIHGCFMFCGAGRTGRWAGRLVQLQNLARNSMPDLDSARSLVKANDEEAVNLIYPDVASTLSELIRTALIPESGHRFIVADYSAIEARVIAWIAHEDWRLKTFEEGGDIYCASASQMFKVPVVKHGENGHLRQKGKIAELACIAKDQLVLTDCGLVPIQKVTTGMKVWDGENWVSHGGVMFKGIKEVIEYEGLRATEDHLVWVEGKSRPICFGAAAESGAHVVETGDGREAIRLGGDYKPIETVEREDEPLLGTDKVYRMRERTVVGPRKPSERKKPWLSVLFPAKKSPDVAVQENERGKAEMREPGEHHVPGVRRPWYSLLFSKCERSLPVHDVSWSSESGSRDRQNRYERELRTGESPMGHPFRELFKSTKERLERMGSEVLALHQRRRHQEAIAWENSGADHRGRQAYRAEPRKELAYNREPVEVYDIRDAGPNHRFTVSGKLVHNCGYGGGVGALKAFGADKVMTEEEMVQTIDQWRSSSPHICALWKSLEKAAIRSVVRKEPAISSVGNILFEYENHVLWMTLPSGRRIAYWGAEYVDDPRSFGKSLSYMGVNQTTRKWERIFTWGGKLVENCWGEGTLVLTNRGWVPIQQVSVYDKLWDGEAWVSHNGAVYQGEREVVSLNGVSVTADHKIYTEKGWCRVGQSHGLYGSEVRLPYGGWAVSETRRAWTNPLEGLLCLRERVRHRHPGFEEAGSRGKDPFMRVSDEADDIRGEQDARNDEAPGLCCLALDDSEMHGAHTSSLEKLRRSWNHGLRAMATQLRKFLGGHGPDLRAGERSGPGGQRARLFSGELPVGNAEAELPKQEEQSVDQHTSWSHACRGSRRAFQHRCDYASVSSESGGSGELIVRPAGCHEPVYDILNAGPRHRYVVWVGFPLLAHNCVQATARDCLKESMLALSAAGFDIRAHVHDEVIITEPIGGRTVEDVCAIMGAPISWAPGLPLRADGYETPYYKKD